MNLSFLYKALGQTYKPDDREQRKMEVRLGQAAVVLIGAAVWMFFAS